MRRASGQKTASASHPKNERKCDIQVVRGKPCRIFSSLSKSLLLLLRKFADKNSSSLLSRPARGAWIEIEEIDKGSHPYTSRPARGAWIEIRNEMICREPDGVVAPRKGRVD